MSIRIIDPIRIGRGISLVGGLDPIGSEERAGYGMGGTAVGEVEFGRRGVGIGGVGEWVGV